MMTTMHAEFVIVTIVVTDRLSRLLCMVLTMGLRIDFIVRKTMCLQNYQSSANLTNRTLAWAQGCVGIV